MSLTPKLLSDRIGIMSYLKFRGKLYPTETRLTITTLKFYIVSPKKFSETLILTAILDWNDIYHSLCETFNLEPHQYNCHQCHHLCGFCIFFSFPKMKCKVGQLLFVNTSALWKMTAISVCHLYQLNLSFRRNCVKVNHQSAAFALTKG